MSEIPRVLISGSAAFDVIAFTQEEISNIFCNALENRDYSEARISISFLVDKQVSFGGTALNIAYTLKLLGGNPLPISCVGKDFSSRKYDKHLQKMKIDTSGLNVIEREDTAEAYIVTGVKGGQMSIFHTGALQNCSAIDINEKVKGENVVMAIISPNPPDTMLAHARKLVELKIPYIADPGQMVNAFSSENLFEFVSNATILIVNDFESIGVERLTGKSLDDLVSIQIVTLGERGVNIKYNEEKLYIPATKIGQLKDPTGAGDAFRGGFLFALSKLFTSVNEIKLKDLKIACQMGAVTGGFAVECSGTQNHSFTSEEFTTRYEEHYNKIEFPL